MKKYNLINNSLGWVIFAIATVTYMLTLEPTASFWDCGEFISQGYKLEVGHPPGNPIFMRTANFFAHFASSPSQVALCVNAMSGLLSSGCILLLFWTVTHLVRRLITKDGQEEYSWMQIALIMGSGVCGALAYAWSDTFWFSAVEGEVYAFSSFCTALTFWLILKWENRSEEPHSDRYLVAIAYVRFGGSPSAQPVVYSCDYPGHLLQEIQGNHRQRIAHCTAHLVRHHRVYPLRTRSGLR